MHRNKVIVPEIENKRKYCEALLLQKEY